MALPASASLRGAGGGNFKTDMKSIPRATPLTPRESEVRHELIQGRDYAAIAKRLGIRMGTLNTHIRSLYFKYGVHSRSELAALHVANLEAINKEGKGL